MWTMATPASTHHNRFYEDRASRLLIPCVSALPTASQLKQAHVELVARIVDPTNTTTSQQQQTVLHTLETTTNQFSGKRALPLASTDASSYYIPTSMFTTHSNQMEGNVQFDILVSGDDRGVVTINGFGSFPIGCVDLSGAFPPQAKPTVSHVRLSADLSSLCAILRGKITQSADDMYAYRLIMVDTTRIAEYAPEIAQVATQCMAIGKEMARIKDTVALISKQWVDHVISTLRNELQPLALGLEQFGRPNSVLEELFVLHTSGAASEPLSMYLNEAQEAQLVKAGKTIDAACAAIELLCTKFLLVACEEIVFRIGELRGYARCEDRFSVVGLHVDVIEHLLSLASDVQYFAEEFVGNVREAHLDISSFICWLRRCSKKHTDPKDFKALSSIPMPDSRRITQMLASKIPHYFDRATIQLFAEQYLKFSPIPEVKRSSSSFTEAAAVESVGPSWDRSRSKRFSPDPANAEVPSSVKPTSSATSAVGPCMTQLFDMLTRKWRSYFYRISETISDSFKPTLNTLLVQVPAKQIRSMDRLIALHDRSSSLSKVGEAEMVIAIALEKKVWILRNSPLSLEWQAACASFVNEPNAIIMDVAFYGECPGPPSQTFLQSGRTEKLILTCQNRDVERSIMGISYDELEFHSLEHSLFFPSPSQQQQQQQKGLLQPHACLLRDDESLPGTIKCAIGSTPIKSVLWKERVLLPASWQIAALHVSGSRGLACVITTNHRICVLDLEHDEES
jgi:hypothetical protein